LCQSKPYSQNAISCEGFLQTQIKNKYLAQIFSRAHGNRSKGIYVYTTPIVVHLEESIINKNHISHELNSENNTRSFPKFQCPMHNETKSNSDLPEHVDFSIDCHHEKDKVHPGWGVSAGHMARGGGKVRPVRQGSMCRACAKSCHLNHAFI
jgi:hypothetical protein